MKKSLVLSIVMCLVLAATMTTATFAWYSANDSVTANINTITAASATGDLQIKFGGQENYGYTTSTNMTGTLNPISPNVVYGTEGNTDATGFLANTKWYTGKKTPTGTTLNQGAPSTNVITGTIELYNASNAATNSIGITVRPSFVAGKAFGELTDLKYIFAEGANVYAYNSYSVVDGNSSSLTNINQDELKVSSPSFGDTTSIGVISGNTTRIITYYIWLDGFEGSNTSMGAQFNMNLQFNAASSYVLTYNQNLAGRTLTSQLPLPAYGTNGNKVTISSETLTSAYVDGENVGKQLTGWNTQADGLGTAYQAGEEMTLSGNTTIYAQWADVHTLRYNLNKPAGVGAAIVGNVANQTQLTNNAETITISATRLSLVGYTFMGWSASASATTATYVPGATGYDLTADVELFAVWQASATLSYDFNKPNGVTAAINGALPASTTEVVGTEVDVTMPTLTLEGYTFAGWATTANAETATYTTTTSAEQLKITLNSNTTLYAVWTE